MSDNFDLLEVIDNIDPSACSYEEWVGIGMALKDGGYGFGAWDSWSQRDSKRYRAGEMVSKWESFRGSAKPITGGSVVNIARSQGWTPPRDEGYELSWDSIIGPHDEKVVIRDSAWIEENDVVPLYAEWDPAKEVTTYLETLFQSEENVCYVTSVWEADPGVYKPKNGCWDRTAGQLVEELNKHRDDIGHVLGDYKPEVGAWVCFNPLDGQGRRNDNVTAFRYALVECDEMEIGKQYAILKQLELPIATLVHSGGKSLHAVVRVDAADMDEYRNRVDYLYDVCKKNGLPIDRQNKNPSRLSRLPGVTRGENRQFIIATNIGRESWSDWQAWIDKVNDDLPEPESLSSVWDDMPELSPPLIDGVLRQGHKMLVVGGSKASKSFALIELACSVAEGRKWLGWQCAKGRVLYVNLELDPASCMHRFKDIYTGLGWKPENVSAIDIWNLRGKSVPMDKLAPKLIRRAQKKDYIAVVIDPIYKVITGDENSADQMAKFCNQFDLVAEQLGCSVIYCHHHSKGAQGHKRSADRASGSGVFARDPDTLLDLVELELTEDVVSQQVNDRTCEAITAWLDKQGPSDWREEISQDAQVVEKAYRDACRELLGNESMNTLIGHLGAVERAVKASTALRIEGTLREFPRFEPRNIWFRYPVHIIDDEGVLKDLSAEGEAPPWQKAKSKRKGNAAKTKASKGKSFEIAVASCTFDSVPPTLDDLAEYFEKSPKTARRYMSEHGGFTVDKNTGRVVRKEAVAGE